MQNGNASNIMLPSSSRSCVTATMRFGSELSLTSLEQRKPKCQLLQTYKNLKEVKKVSPIVLFDRDHSNGTLNNDAKHGEKRFASIIEKNFFPTVITEVGTNYQLLRIGKIRERV